MLLSRVNLNLLVRCIAGLKAKSSLLLIETMLKSKFNYTYRRSKSSRALKRKARLEKEY